MNGLLQLFPQRKALGEQLQRRNNQMPTKRRAKITALGRYVPPRVVTNYDLAKMVETNHDWIVERTGIHERH